MTDRRRDGGEQEDDSDEEDLFLTSRRADGQISCVTVDVISSRSESLVLIRQQLRSPPLTQLTSVIQEQDTAAPFTLFTQLTVVVVVVVVGVFLVQIRDDSKTSFFFSPL